MGFISKTEMRFNTMEPRFNVPLTLKQKSDQELRLCIFYANNKKMELSQSYLMGSVDFTIQQMLKSRPNDMGGFSRPFKLRNYDNKSRDRRLAYTNATVFLHSNRPMVIQQRV